MPHGCSQAWSGILCANPVACLQGSLGPEGPESLADPRTTRKRATGSTKDQAHACCVSLLCEVGLFKGHGVLADTSFPSSLQDTEHALENLSTK